MIRGGKNLLKNLLGKFTSNLLSPALAEWEFLNKCGALLGLIFQAAYGNDKHTVVRTFVGIIAYSRKHHQERRLLHFCGVELVG